MIDISKYTSKGPIKPVLNYVYVHKIDGILHAVATDSFRIAQVKVWRLLAEHIQEGFYTPKAWKEITKLLNKDSHSVTLELKELVTREMAVQTDESFPDYQTILPKYEDCEPFKGDFHINGDYLCELIKSVQDKKFKKFNFNKLLEYKGMTVYMDEDTVIQIMGMK